MDDSGFLQSSLIDKHVVIWGLGLMGGSLAMALKGKCSKLSGIDHSPDVIKRALDLHIIDCGSTDEDSVIVDPDILIIATPISSILSTLDDLKLKKMGHVVLLDIGSTKREIINKMIDLPSCYDPVGGHPMCGKEKGSFENADPAIFRGATFALVSLPRTSEWAVTMVEDLTETIGSHYFWIDAVSHDEYVASTSHLPFLIANALARSMPQEAHSLVGPGFRSTARLAGTPFEMMMDIIKTNDDNIKRAFSEFRIWLDRYEQLLEKKEWESLSRELMKGREMYQYLIDEGSK